MKNHPIQLLALFIIIAAKLTACGPNRPQVDQVTEVPVATLTALAVTNAAPTDATAEPIDQTATPADALPVPSDTVPTPTDTAAEPTEDVPVPTETVPAATTLTIWHPWTGAQLEVLQPELDAFAELHPDVGVSLVPAPDLPQALTDNADPVTAPDLLVGSARDLGDLARAGRIVPLDANGIDPAALTAHLSALVAQAITMDGHTWAAPFGQSGLALVYNKAALPQNYVPASPDDLNDLLTKSFAFKQDFLSQYPLCISANDAYHLAPIYFGFGLPAYVDGTGRAYLDTPEANAAGHWLATISPVVSPYQSDEQCQLDFSEGTVAMWWTGPEALPAISAAGIDYGILPMGRPYVDVQALMLTQQAVDRGHAALAAELIQRLTSPEVQKALALPPFSLFSIRVTGALQFVAKGFLCRLPSADCGLLSHLEENADSRYNSHVVRHQTPAQAVTSPALLVESASAPLMKM